MTDVSCPAAGQAEILILLSWLSVILVLVNAKL